MYSYRIKVPSAGVNIWGGEKLLCTLKSPLFLCLKVDDIGEAIQLVAFTADGNHTDSLGTLAPGEVFCFPLNDITSLKATPDINGTDSFVDCSVISVIAPGSIKYSSGHFTRKEGK